jgi:fused signal recognition particle receptor
MAASPGWLDALQRTRRAAFGRLAALLGAGEITPAVWEEVEALLIQADLGPTLASKIRRELQFASGGFGLARKEELQRALRAQLVGLLSSAEEFVPSQRPSVILVVGVNGSGKTTTIAKLAQRFCTHGYSVLLAAADTYRAAASEQLGEWAARTGVEVVHGKPQGDPGAVAHDAAQAALARAIDVLLVDTAGRLHTRFNLMEELKKVHRVLGKVVAGAPHETWLVLDATGGQNALFQARAFKAAVDVTGVILAKLDGSAKGGMVFAIQEDLALPVRYVGLGESSTDLALFDRERFVDGLLAVEGAPLGPLAG